MNFCGVSIEHDEEGLCPQHLAERWGVSVHAIHGRAKTGYIEKGVAKGIGKNLDCGRRRKQRQIIPMGQILNFEDERQAT